MIDLDFLTKYSRFDFINKRLAYILSLVVIGFGAPLAFATSQSSKLYTSSIDLNSSLTPLLNGPMDSSTDFSEPQQPTKAPSSSQSADVSVSASSQDGQSPKLSAKVNGQSIHIDQDGSFHKVIHDDNSKTEIDVNISGNSAASNQSTNSTSIQINSQSYSSGSETNDVEGIGN